MKAAMDELQLIVTELILQADHLIIAGDFNIDLLATSSVIVSYSNLLSDLHLVQHFSQPSRITSTSSTLIDHVITSPNVVVNSAIETVGLSDHLMQALDISKVQLIKPMKTVMHVRSLRHCDWDAVREYLRTAPWHVMDIFDDINDKWNFFKSCLHYALNQHAPIKKHLQLSTRRDGFSS